MDPPVPSFLHLNGGTVPVVTAVSKPVERQAVKWTGNVADVINFTHGAFTLDGGRPALWIAKSHAWTHVVEIGDWVVAEPDGDGFYPVKGRIFAELYETGRRARLVPRRWERKRAAYWKKLALMSPDARVARANERIRQLEAKLTTRRHWIARLEDCRRWERGTERMLVAALTLISETESQASGMMARAALHTYDLRHGPRPVDEP